MTSTPTPERKRSELTTIMCVFALLLLLSLGASYAMYMFRETTAVKLIVAILTGSLALYAMSIIKVGPFKNRR